MNSLRQKCLLCLALFMALHFPTQGFATSAEFVATPYAEEQKIVFDFYFDDPHKIDAALYWLKGLIEPLMAPPYNYAPDDIDIKVVLHGTEVVSLAKHNYAKYRRAVERMRYYADLGVEFRVCAFTAHDYGYQLTDLQDFVQVIPSGLAELAHWQNQGYVLIAPRIQERHFTIDEIR